MGMQGMGGGWEDPTTAQACQPSFKFQQASEEKVATKREPQKVRLRNCIRGEELTKQELKKGRLVAIRIRPLVMQCYACQ